MKDIKEIKEIKEMKKIKELKKIKEIKETPVMTSYASESVDISSSPNNIGTKQVNFNVIFFF